jgi:glyoxylase-like metal-dependent hydrolase (beta-lactamase superfamily II)
MRPIMLLLLVCLSAPAWAQMDDVEIKTTPLTDSIYMLEGAGGNLVVCVGDDGNFLIDDQFAPLTDKIRAAIAAVHQGDVRFVLNTHWHFDHTGGNENFGKAGSVIVAHDNVRARMSVDSFSEFLDRESPASPHEALPVVTFTDGLTFHLNGHTIEVTHFAHAHTDGDAIVHFREANVIHTGDIVFYGLYPFIDVESGGSIDGVIAACAAMLELADDATKFVPGHGPIIGRAELATYHDMLVEIRSRVVARMEAGDDLEAIKASRPTAEWDEALGQAWLTGDQFTELVVRGLSD